MEICFKINSASFFEILHLNYKKSVPFNQFKNFKQSLSKYPNHLLKINLL